MEWSNLAKIVTRRTYSRKDNGRLENWDQIIERAVAGNTKGHNVSEKEIQTLLRLGKTRKAIPAGRGLWFSGTEAHRKIGGVALNNCYFIMVSDWEHFVLAADLLMLGAGVGASVEVKNITRFPKVKKDVIIQNIQSRDADYIVPDSRQGWCNLMSRVFEAFFVTGRSFSYSTICVRGKGEEIKGFGGIASGPLPLVAFVDNVNVILSHREGKHIRPIDAADIITSIGEVVVSGNVRRSAILLLGDPWDKEFLTAKRWDLGTVPGHRSCANYSVVCSDTEDLHPLYWKTFEAGEAFGVVNRKTIQKYGRMGERELDTAEGVNPCSEATLEHAEACNLQEIALPNLDNEQEFVLAAKLMHRWGKRVSLEHYHHDAIQSVVSRNHRVGTGITGCLASPLFNPQTLDTVYEAIQEENRAYSKELKIPKSIRTTVIKPSGTVSKVLDMGGYEGIHAAYSRFAIQRIRFASNDPLIPLLQEANHYMEPTKKLDGTLDHNTLVVDFYAKAPDGHPVADEDFDTWKQLDILLLAQKHWADQAVSVSIYYQRQDILRIKEWLSDNISRLKTISFISHSEHGFLQAPKEAVSKETFEKLSEKIKPIDLDKIGEGVLDSQECGGASCPVK
jgi:ribonucleotide reductase alpha subunit